MGEKGDCPEDTELGTVALWCEDEIKQSGNNRDITKCLPEAWYPCVRLGIHESKWYNSVRAWLREHHGHTVFIKKNMVLCMNESQMKYETGIWEERESNKG